MSAGANAKKAAVKQPHLSDLFRAGEEVTVVGNDETEYTIWVVRPSSLQQDESREKANGKMARMKLAAMDKESDRYVSLKLSFAEITDHGELIDSRLQYEETDARDLSFNEVLYEEDSKWSKDDKYLGLIAAITTRYSEILKYNEQMKEAGSDECIVEDSDKELADLLEEQEVFRAEVDVRLKVHISEERELLEQKTDEELREELMDLALDLEARMMWYEAFKTRMLFYACRYNDDRKKFYFDSADDVFEVPDYVRTQLYRAYERVEQGSDDLKNLLSLPNS